jgi:hypothetical protein
MNLPPTGGPSLTISFADVLGLIDVTSNAARSCCAKAIQRGASEATIRRTVRTIALAATLLAEARGEKVRPQRSRISIRSPMRDLLPKIPIASISRDSVRIGFLRVVDDEKFDGTLFRLEPESELLLDRGKNRWPRAL